jgi:CDP-6-deoxy-D-xylo-4-hexulose-3-dehydrase
MNKYNYPTAFNSWGEEEKAAIHRVLDSGNFTIGKEVEAFEEEFAKYHGMQYGIGVNSGSSANLIAVAALFHKKETESLKRNDLAIVPAIAWSTTYSPLMQLGLNLYVSDVDSTWNAIEVDSRAEDARLVIGCSILGNPAYLPEWKEWAGIHDAYFIEDNCESLGATVSNQLCGTFGIMNTFSFFYSHQLNCIEGGMILTNDEECYKLCKMLRNHGMTRGVIPINDFDDEYSFVYPGYNVRPLEMHFAVAREQLKKLSNLIQARIDNFMYFAQQIEKLASTGHIQLQAMHPSCTKISPFGLAFNVYDNIKRYDLVNKFRENGIDARLPTGGSFLRHPYAIDYKSEFKTPNADSIHEGALFIGNAPFPIHDKIDKAVKIIKEVL